MQLQEAVISFGADNMWDRIESYDKVNKTPLHTWIVHYYWIAVLLRFVLLRQL